MFAGLVQRVGKVTEFRQNRIWVKSAGLKAKLGDSIAINGTCLTVAAKSARKGWAFVVSPETFKKTTLETLKSGDSVNVETSLKLSDNIGGHIVQGHVDGVGRVEKIQKQGDMKTIWFKAPPEILKYLVQKGSVAVDGVSLTVAGLTKTSFSVALIPYTLKHTTLGTLTPGTRVNLEADIFGKYIAKYLKK